MLRMGFTILTIQKNCLSISGIFSPLKFNMEGSIWEFFSMMCGILGQGEIFTRDHDLMMGS